MGGGSPSEATKLRRMLKGLEELNFMKDTIKAFEVVGEAMVKAKIEDVDVMLTALRRAMEDEHGI
jgi:hypothetical protein